MKKYLWLFSIFIFSTACCADVLILKSGDSVEGAIVDRNDDAIKINVGGVDVKYYMDEIERVEMQPEKNVNVVGAAPADLVPGNPVPEGPGKAPSDPTLATEIVRDDFFMYMNRGNMYRKTWHEYSRIFDINKVIKISPDSAELYKARGLRYYDLNDCSRAFSDFKKVEEMDPQLADETLYNKLGKGNNKKRDCDPAFVNFTKFRGKHIQKVGTPPVQQNHQELLLVPGLLKK